jgi:arsenate reductase (thioredoxin)
MKVAFVCVQNAGRSQMSAAFAERKAKETADSIEVLTGGTQPADSVHEEVIDVMEEVGVDLSNRTPQEITPENLQNCDYIITMGCSAEGVCPATWSGENRDWGLDDPHGKDVEEVREIRDEIETRVEALFDELTTKKQTAN